MNYKIEEPENQRKCILPMNDISTTIFYNQRIAISARIKEPIVWRCTKIEQTAPKGTNRVTFAQDQWDEHVDAILNDGIWCNYYSSSITPEDYEPPKESSNEYGIITFNGISQDIKIGGKGRKLTIKFYIEDEEVPFETGTWSYFIDDIDVSSMIEQELISDNEINIKFIGEKTYIGKTLLVKYITDNDIETQLELAIKNL